MAAAITFTDSGVDGTDAASYTFSSKSIGTAAADRYVLVSVFARGGDTFTFSMTIGGSSATEELTVLNSGSAFNRGSLFKLLVTSGTTADVVVTTSASVFRCGIDVYTLTGSDGALSDSFTSTADDGTGTIDCPANGSIVAGGGCGSNVTCAWTGLTEDDDQQIAGETSRISSASDDFASAQSGLTVTADWDAPATGRSTLVCASYGPTAASTTRRYSLSLTGVG